MLQRDLPFITRLSKYYDLSLFNNTLSDKPSNSINNKPKPITNLLEKDNKDRYQNFENRFDNVDVNINKAFEILSGNKLRIENTTPSKYNNIDDPVLGKMRRQSQTENI